MGVKFSLAKSLIQMLAKTEFGINEERIFNGF